MSRGLAYAVTALAAFGAMLLLLAPATWIADAIDDASGHRVQFREASGTVWNGSARLLARTPERLLDLGIVRWTARPAGVLPPTVRAELHYPAARQPVRMEISPRGVALGRLELQLPASILTLVAPALASFGPKGTIHVRADGLRLERAAYFGLAEVEWGRAALQSQPGLALGSHVARLRGGGDKVDIDLSTLEGPLSLTGRATWRANAGFEVAGTAEARSPEMVPLLKAVCGSYQGTACPFAYRSER